ncbi:MAG: CHAT domain-containing protein [Balneolaceae bacterium]|nr:MAG: CHAT domain-containing protein [Balneolaceae bacterium]
MFSATKHSSLRSYFTQFWVAFALSLLFNPLLAFPPQPQDERLTEATELFFSRDYDTAYSKIIDLTDRFCNDETIADLCIQAKTTRINIYRTRQNTPDAESFIERALSLAANSDRISPQTTANLYVQISYYHLEASEMQNAFEWSEKSLNIVEENNIQGVIKARAIALNARLLHADGRFDDAIIYYNGVLEILESLEPTFEITSIVLQVHNNIGISHRRLGNINTAMEHYQTNLRLVRETFGENHIELVFAYNSIGSVYYGIGDYATAGEYFERSASVSRAVLGENSTRYLIALNNAGVSYIQLGDLTRASEVLERAQRLRENTFGPTHTETAIGYQNLGNIYSQIGRFHEAQQNFELALSLLTSHYGENHINLVGIHTQLGDFYRLIDEYELAREQYRITLTIIESSLGAAHPDVWDINQRIGRSYLQQYNYRQAKYYYTEAIRLITEESGFLTNEQIEFDALSHPLFFLEAVRGLADSQLMAFRNSGNPEYLQAAESHYLTAADIVEYLQTRYLSEASKLNLLKENYAIYSNSIEIFYHQFGMDDDERWLEKMFEWSERSRSRIAAELLQGIDARYFAGVPSDVLDEERQLNQTITNLYTSLHREQERGFDADEAVTSAFRDSLFYAKEQLLEFTRSLEASYPSYYYLRYDLTPANVSLARSLLSDDETLISYSFTEEMLLALLVDKDGISVVNLGQIDEIPTMVEQLREAVLSGKSDEFSELSYRLYQHVMEPLRDKISTSKLVIIPDHILHFLPFELLLSNPANDNIRYNELAFLIRDYKISYTPSISVLNRMEQRRSDNPRNFLAMAPFNQTISDFSTDGQIERFAGNLAPLPLTRYETTEIAKLFRQRRTFADFFSPQRAEIFLHTDASKQQLHNSSLQDFSFIHFATHAFVNESDPEFSGIVLWGDEDDPGSGIVYVADIYNLTMNADLVVLGACETGLGTMYRGEGIIGFTRAFLYAGAANLVVSKWRVSDQPTSRLMIYFYQYIKEGYTYREALQLAKLELVDHPEFAAPINWAAFVLQGR